MRAEVECLISLTMYTAPSSLDGFSTPSAARQSAPSNTTRTNPLVHPDSMVSGWYYSVQTGELQRVC
jgi:hypothetical protein